MSIQSPAFKSVGWLCVAGCAVLAIDLLFLLAELPSDWWLPAAEPAAGEFAARLMHVDFFFGWFGWWGYLANLVWLPAAAWKVRKATMRGETPSQSERLLLVGCVVLPVLISALVHLTPLKYPSYNVFLF